MSDRHLNIFHHYTQANSLPIENNLSRGLAIILQEYPAVMMLFIEKLKSQFRKRLKDQINPVKTELDIDFPKDTYEVDFQRRTNSFDVFEHIVGVALTAADLQITDNEDDEDATGTTIPITDISISYDDTLIIIEVKRDATDCIKQLDNQIQQYKSFITSTMGSNSFQEDIVSISWEDITKLLNQFQSINSSKSEKIVTDYLDELVYHFPTWSPAEPLYKLTVFDKDRINKRLTVIKNEYLKQHSSDKQLQYDRGAIPLEWNYASECNIFLIDNFENEKGEIKPHICIGVWPSDTCYQFSRLKSKTTFDFASSHYLTRNLQNYGDVKIRIEPYIKMCHFNKEVMSLHMEYDANNDNKILNWINLANQITGKRNRDQWDDLKDQIENSTIFSDKKISWFKTEFCNQFEKTNRNYVVSSIGFEIYAYIEFEEAQRIEKDTNGTGLCDLIGAFLTDIKPFIEK